MKTLVETLQDWPFTPNEQEHALWNKAMQVAEEGDRRIRDMSAVIQQALNAVTNENLSDAMSCLAASGILAKLLDLIKPR